MLEDRLKQEIQSAYSQFLTRRGLKARSAQKQMIAEVARTLGGIKFDEQGKRLGETHIAAIEAGTGTGKTIAYLLAALPIARARGLTLLVSTATVALQEQLINKDLPELMQHTEWPIRYTLAKGRGRYLCLSKVEQLLEQQQAFGQMALYEDELAERLDETTLERYRDWMESYASGRWDGDRDRLQGVVSDEDWKPLTSDHMQCSNRRCLNYSVCPFYRAREQAEEADLIVANHDLVLADLSLGGGAILPEPAKTLYIFDEGHHLADKAAAHFSYSLRLGSSIKMLASMEKKLRQFADSFSSSQLATLVEQLQLPTSDLILALEQWSEQVHLLSFEEETGRIPRHRFIKGRQPENWLPLANEVRALASRMENLLEQLTGLLKEAMEGQQAEIPRVHAEAFYPQLGVYWSRIQQMNWLAESYARIDAENVSPTARWVLQHEANAALPDYECCSSPVSVAQTFREHLWSVCFGALITSATLTALGQFTRLSVSLGLPIESRFLQLQSPFDYQTAASLEIPSMQTEPSQPDAHTDEVASYLQTHLPQMPAALVLFSSWRQMLRVLDQLDESVKNRILAQGALSKMEILQQHRQRIDEGLASIIFGLASFAEGVDLPGRYLTEVVITKLPFSVPDDPVDATMAEWIEARGGNPFIEWTIPAASVRLTQAVGRLLRTEQDRGRVVILDRRLLTRRYGRQLLNALPPFQALY
ncbi:ATP-dependent DNA helicase DinG [Nitrincola tapanii]|uniref:ATP-dependent DNA helicase DinG n=1 Tax=Nitrincola tapanii TaxID=1708751 RepID=A0A5A9W5L4_9GAMM|nr:ATP-dependent DNA helicase DinG [Nitrincola tapanii]KAA0875833.1 ATP-dependent DNA helicase DinG [Nitrincola tapanii]